MRLRLSRCCSRRPSKNPVVKKQAKAAITPTTLPITTPRLVSDDAAFSDVGGSGNGDVSLEGARVADGLLATGASVGTLLVGSLSSFPSMDGGDVSSMRVGSLVVAATDGESVTGTGPGPMPEKVGSNVLGARDGRSVGRMVGCDVVPDGKDGVTKDAVGCCVVTDEMVGTEADEMQGVQSP